MKFVLSGITADTDSPRGCLYLFQQNPSLTCGAQFQAFIPNLKSLS